MIGKMDHFLKSSNFRKKTELQNEQNFFQVSKCAWISRDYKCSRTFFHWFALSVANFEGLQMGTPCKMCNFDRFECFILLNSRRTDTLIEKVSKWTLHFIRPSYRTVAKFQIVSSLIFSYNSLECTHMNFRL